MKRKRFFAALLAGAMMLSVTACSQPDAAAPTDEEYAAWATEHGYVLEPEKNGYVLASNQSKPESKTDSATATAEGYEETVTVTLSVTDGKISQVDAQSTSTSEIGKPALEEMPKAMVEQNSVEVDAVTGATGTSNAILTAARAAMAELTEKGAVSGDLNAWALSNGYVKAADYNLVSDADAVSSATQNKMGGVNYGAIEWDADLQADAIREFLKGGKYLGDPAYAQDDTGYNYREMYQMATSTNNVPSNTNLEMVLDADTLHLVGVSEAGTGKTIEFQRNPHVSVSWCRQLRLENEEAGYNYYCSYGVQYNGVVKIYTAADLETPEGQDAIINLYDTYYPTLASTWMGYSAGFAEAADEAAVREAKLAYAEKNLSTGAMVVYEIIPESIVVTAPFLMNMIPQMANASTFTTVQDGADKYPYDLGISDAFMDKLVEYKASYISTPEGEAAVTDYYTSGPLSAMFTQLDAVCGQMGMPTSLEAALSTDNAAGLKTQTTYIPEQ